LDISFKTPICIIIDDNTNNTNNTIINKIEKLDVQIIKKEDNILKNTIQKLFKYLDIAHNKKISKNRLLKN